MVFDRSTYPGLVVQRSEAQARFVAEADDGHTEADVIVVGSGVGGGLLADQLADSFRREGGNRSVLVLEAGSYLFPTHVYNVCRFDNADVAGRYAVSSFRQDGAGGDQPRYIHERPQLNLGGRSVFWSGLIPEIQPWELRFFPAPLRDELIGLVADAGRALNQSRTLGELPSAVAAALAASPEIDSDFVVAETPRALHQPYLTESGVPAGQYWIEPTGVFNTAELLINQAGLPSGADDGHLRLLLDHYVESVTRRPDDRYEVLARDLVGDRSRTFVAPIVVLAGGSLESPKVLRRSPVFDALPPQVRALVGRGLTDHPTTSWVEGVVTEIAGVAVPPDQHAKIILYSRGRDDPAGATAFPFNVEMNVNARYWHRRENDPDEVAAAFRAGEKSIVEIKFSFGNCLDDGNEMVFDDLYRPDLRFANLQRVKELAEDRFRRSAGWRTDIEGVWDTLRGVTDRVFGTLRDEGEPVVPARGYVGENGKGFGWGTVHHAVGTLRMPARAGRDDPGFGPSVVDTDLRVVGEPGLYVCDMSVLPFSSAANPVRTLTALTLRLAARLSA